MIMRRYFPKVCRHLLLSFVRGYARDEVVVDADAELAAQRGWGRLGRFRGADSLCDQSSGWFSGLGFAPPCLAVRCEQVTSGLLFLQHVPRSLVLSQPSELRVPQA
jgi:hypothetical protein